MSSPERPSLLVRAATLTLAVGTLIGLVVHSSMAAGCNNSGSSTAPTATPDLAAPPALPSAASPNAPASPSGQASPGSASPTPGAAQNGAPADTARPGAPRIVPRNDYLPASKSGMIFRIEEPAPNAAPPPPPPQQNAAPPPPQQNAAPNAAGAR
jgi:hypothetical protein